MYTVWHVDKHKITFKLTNDKSQKSLSRPSIIDARAHYWAAARLLRSIGLRHELSSFAKTLESWVRIPFVEGMPICLFVFSCASNSENRRKSSASMKTGSKMFLFSSRFS
jgi:hypothetical protein